MNPETLMTQALKSLREPLPPEHSLVPGVLARIDQATLVDRVPSDRPSAARPMHRRWPGKIGAVAMVILAFVLLSLFRTGTSLTLAEVRAAVERERWVHLIYQDGSETWVCLDDGRYLMKQVRDSQPARYFLRDPVTRTEQHFDSTNEIRLSSPDVWVLGRQRNCKIIPLEVDALTFDDEDLSEPRQTPDEERNELLAVRDFEIVVENGRKLGHFSDFRRDALGELQIDKELWVDLTTKLPVRIRSWEFAANTATRVPREGTYHFVQDGPSDLYSLGVPGTVPIVPQIHSAEAAKRLIPAETWKAIDGAKAAVRTFPHRFRVLTLDEGSRQTITYVDSGDTHPFEWAGDESAEAVGKYFFADCQRIDKATPEFAELVEKSSHERELPIPADALAREFPFQSAVNTRLVDGRRWFILTRSSRSARLQVLTASSSQEVREIGNQWEYAGWNWTELATGKSTETAPEGQILVHAERRDLKNDWFVDPDRDFTVARHIEYRLIDDRWDKRETRAVKWERLPGGPWYVSAWETHSRVMTTRIDADGKQVQQEESSVYNERIVITPLRADEFPADIFDGDKFLGAAQAIGAKVRVD